MGRAAYEVLYKWAQAVVFVEPGSVPEGPVRRMSQSIAQRGRAVSLMRIIMRRIAPTSKTSSIQLNIDDCKMSGSAQMSRFDASTVVVPYARHVR